MLGLEANIYNLKLNKMSMSTCMLVSIVLHTTN